MTTNEALEQARRAIGHSIDAAIDLKLAALEHRLRTDIAATGEALDPASRREFDEFLVHERTRLITSRDRALGELDQELFRQDLHP